MRARTEGNLATSPPLANSLRAAALRGIEAKTTTPVVAHTRSTPRRASPRRLATVAPSCDRVERRPRCTGEGAVQGCSPYVSRPSFGMGHGRVRAERTRASSGSRTVWTTARPFTGGGKCVAGVSIGAPDRGGSGFWCNIDQVQIWLAAPSLRAHRICHPVLIVTLLAHTFSPASSTILHSSIPATAWASTTCRSGGRAGRSLT